MDREPCPWRIVDDAGAAFAMGAIGGSAFNLYRGARNAPSGLARRYQGAMSLMRQRAPITGGNFAAWGGLFSVVDCSLASLRQKEDPWNSILSGFATGGLLQIRQGPAAALGSAVVGGVILALIEGVSILMTRMSGNQILSEQMAAHHQQQQHNQ